MQQWKGGATDTSNTVAGTQEQYIERKNQTQKELILHDSIEQTKLTIVIEIREVGLGVDYIRT